jgi:hypothetical protein
MSWIMSLTSFGGIILVWWGFLSFAQWALKSSGDANNLSSPVSGSAKIVVGLGLIVALLSSYVLLVRGGAKTMFEMEPGEELYHRDP